MLTMSQETHALNSAIRSDFSTFVKKSFASVNPSAEYLHNWHVDVLAEYLQACERGEITRLLINVPPRSLKSITVSVAWPAWLLGHDPARRVIAASYAQGLSDKLSLDCKLVMESAWYRHAFAQVQFRAGQNDKSKFVTAKQGFRLATSVGGSVTGEGADFLIADDPHKPSDCYSDVKREAVLNWFDQTFSTRLNDKKKGVMVVVMQRLHEEDLAGHVLKKKGWEHVCLPMEARAKEVFDIGSAYAVREAGELLHSARDGAVEIARLKEELGSYIYAAQYQQSPTPLAGGMIKRHWFERYDVVPEREGARVVQSWDTAIKAGANNDYSVCTTWLEKGGEFYLLDCLCERLEYPALKRAIVSHAKQYDVDVILLEDKASGQSLLQDLGGGNLVLIGIMPTQDKVTRVAAISAMIEAGKVYLPHEASWLAEFEEEAMKFPKVVHDDRVDSMSQFLQWIRKSYKKKISIRSL
jgi:predicted phage terminase large subunit-like protein